MHCVGLAKFQIKAGTWCESAEEGPQLYDLRICNIRLSHAKTISVLSRLSWDYTQSSGGRARADLVKFWILSRLSSTERAKARLWENQARRCSMGVHCFFEHRMNSGCCCCCCKPFTCWDPLEGALKTLCLVQQVPWHWHWGPISSCVVLMALNGAR